MQIRNMNSRVIKEIFWHTYCVWFYVNISVSRYQPSAIIRIKWYNVVWDPNRAQKLQLQLFFSCWLIQTKIDLTPERFYVRNKCRLLESTHGESKKEHRNACVCAYFLSSLIANDLRHIFSYVIWLSGDGFKFVLCLTHTSPVTYNMTE